MKRVPIGVSARHVHLSEEHISILFGTGYELKPFKPLSQPGEFSAQETVIVEGPSGKFENVRILGPARSRTQIEISRTDSYTLGIPAPLRDSGDLDGTPGAVIRGPNGAVTLQEGVIVSARHIHLHTKDAEAWNIRDRQLLRVRVGGERSLIFENVMARISDRFALNMHIDTDEANACGVKTGDLAEILD